MSQEYTEDKHIRFKKLSSGRRLLEVILLAICLSAIFLMVALLSFNPSDPSWSQTTWNAPVKNLGGSVGSWSADILFSAFGILAFAIPPLLLLGCWSIYRYESQRRYIDFFSLSLRLIGGLALILSSCGLAALNFDDLPNFSSGGVIGSVFSNAIMPWFNALGATLALLFLWAISFTLFTGWSWLTIAEKIGAAVLIPLTLMTNRARGDDTVDYDVEEAEDALQRAQEAERQAIENFDADSDDVLFSSPTISELAAVDVGEPQATTQPVAMQTEHTDTPVASSLAAEDENLPSFSATEQQEAYHFEVPDDYQPVVYDRDFQFKTNENPQAPSHAVQQPENSLNDVLTHSTNPSREQPVDWQSLNHAQPQTASPSLSQQQAEQQKQAPIEQNTLSSFSGPSGAQNTPEPTMPISPVSDAVSQANGQSMSDRVADPAALAAAGISVAALERHAQVKQNLEPELPRPNPVRLPTRRELYGIRIPSQRDAELQRRKEEALQREQVYQQWSSSEENQQQDDDNEQENRLREQFLQQQRERYGVDEDSGHDDDASIPLDITPSEPRSEKIEPVATRYTQPDIEHRWPTSSTQVEPQVHQLTTPDNGLSTQPSEHDRANDSVEPNFDLSEHISVLDSFSPVNDLVNEEPADPLFMPSFSATTTASNSNTPPVDNTVKNVSPMLDSAAYRTDTVVPQ
ncbi:DNA translocase FtsK 4TM domain-containing protein, partial [Providencia sp. PROV089]